MNRYLLMFAVALLMPVTADASSLPDLNHLYDGEFHLQSTVISRLPNSPSVLGASTGGTRVTKKLDRAYVSYFRDISFKPPKGWYTSDDADDTSAYTYAVNDEMTAEIAIERFDATDLTLTEITSYVEEVCEVCGYEVVGKGKTKLGKLKGNYVEASNGEYHKEFLIFVREDIAYIIQFTTLEEEWSAYRKILEKSAKSIKFF